jgi:transcriptional regulator with XRE-family HTH domain
MSRLANRIPQYFARKELRDNRRYSQHDMAVATNLSDNAISRIMRYETLDNISFGSIVAIADWLGVENPRDLAKPFDENEDVGSKQ